MPGHSSIIEMSLRVDNREFEVVQSGDDFLILKYPETFPAGPAIYSITIDGETEELDTWVEGLDNGRMVRAGHPEPSSAMVAEP